MRRGLWLAAFVLGVFALATPAAATPIIIDFSTGTGGPGGTIVVTDGVVTGSGILIDSLTVLGAPVSGVFDVNGTGTGHDGPSGVLNFVYGGGANSISITGGIPALDIPNGTVLLSGTFADFWWVNTNSVYGAGPDAKSELLLRELGVPLDTQFKFFGFSIAMPDYPYTAYSTDISNTSVPDAGSSLLLMGLGLAGLGVWRKRLG